MQRTHLLCFLLVGFLLGPGVGVSRAGPITWYFSGEVTSIFDRDGALGDSVVVGSPFVGSFTFESETPDVRPDRPDLAYYNLPFVSISGTIGSLTFSLGPGPQWIRVIDNYPVADRHDVHADVEFFDQTASFRWTLSDHSKTVFSSDELPITPIDLNSFDYHVATITNVDAYSTEPFWGEIRVEITSITPEPGSLALLLMGVAIVGRRRVSRLR